MTKTVMGDVLSDEAAARWAALSGVDKMVLVRAKQARDEAQREDGYLKALPEKPGNWDRLSPSDRRTWFLMQEREAK